MRKYFGESLDVVQKTSAADFKTRADDESETAILKILTAEFPNYNIYAEESGKIDKNSEFTFAIDPLDGTNNFVLGIANFSVSIGLLKGDEMLVGVVYSPIIDNAYYAERGRGAYMDDKKLSVSKETDIEKATICHNLSWEGPEEEGTDIIKDFYIRGAKRVLSNWSPAFDLCMLASGRVEGSIINGPELYDFAAGKLIAHEAGAMVTDFSGNQEGNDKNNKFIVSNGTELHRHMVEVMSKKRVYGKQGN